ncbi:MAG: hypothetical protein U0326_32860 [Polyangiales bacterium]
MDAQPTNTDDESNAPRPWSLTVAALATTGLGLIEARVAEDTLTLVRGAAPQSPVSFETAVQYAFWACAQEHRRGFVALEVARLILAGFLFLAGVRVLVRSRGSGWLWRQALWGNVAVTLVAAWHERAILGDWNAAFGRAVAMVSPALPSPAKGVTLQEVFRRGSQMSVWATGLLALMFVLALRYASRERTRAVID